jgi:peptidoglycan L-alanyl-D-glutamate endopeptidase CwlK
MVCAEMAALGWPLFIVEGLRSEATQAHDFASGRAAPGKIVTMRNGTTHPSKHQAKADGFGHAVDLAFISGDPWAESHPWAKLGALVESHGLVWGGRFAIVDRPHVEWPATVGKIA